MEIAALATYEKANDSDNDESKSADDNDVNGEANEFYFRGNLFWMTMMRLFEWHLSRFRIRSIFCIV